MSGFSADWLTLREPYDLRARTVEAARSTVSSRCGPGAPACAAIGSDVVAFIP